MKHTILLNGFYLILAILAPIQSVMLAAAALILLDLVTGVWCALKTKQVVTSNGLRRTVTKMCAFQIAILTAFLMEQYLLVGIPCVKVIAGLIATAEGKSILENVSIISGVDLVKTLLSKLQDVKLQDKVPVVSGTPDDQSTL